MISLIQAIDALAPHLDLDGSGRITRADRDRVLAALAPVAKHPVASEIGRCLDTGSFAGNRLLACSEYAARRGMITAVVSTPYIKDAADRRKVCLQAFAFEDHPARADMDRHFPAPLVRPVAVRAATGELSRRLRYVAFFPDALIGNVPADYAYGIYFPEKFATVMQTRILPVIEALWSPGAFATLRSMTREDLVRAAAVWVHLHEYHHVRTALPISDYPVVKNTRLAGAFEELRVDLTAMGTPIAPAVGAVAARQVFEFILAFRLIYYATCFAPETDFDAITSVALVNMLAARGCIGTDPKGRYHFAGGETPLRTALTVLQARMTEMEAAVAHGLRGRRGDAAAERAARPVFETAIRLMCGAGAAGDLRRGPFHALHATVSEGVAAAA